MTLDAAALAGLKVVEFAHIIAGPLAGVLLADLGATVVHVEDPGKGDPHRGAGPAREGVHLWWKIANRNKRSVTLNLRTAQGRALGQELAAWADVVITNFRVETLEKWGLDFAALNRVNPRLVMLQVTGFGATSSRRNEPGFGKVGEAMSGVVNITGFAGEPPVHAGFSNGDSVTGLMGAFAIQAALYRKAHDPAFKGEWIDLALYETLFRLIEWQVVLYDQLGTVPERIGNKLVVAPASVVGLYRTADEHWLTVTSGTPRSVMNVASLVGEPPGEYADRALQKKNSGRLDRLLGEWIAQRTLAQCMETIQKLEVVASPIYSVKDILEDETYRERENVVTVEDPELGSMRMQNVVPRLVNHGGAVWRTAPRLGEDNELVYKAWIGKSDAEFAALRSGNHI